VLDVTVLRHDPWNPCPFCMPPFHVLFLLVSPGFLPASLVMDRFGRAVPRLGRPSLNLFDWLPGRVSYCPFPLLEDSEYQKTGLAMATSVETVTFN